MEVGYHRFSIFSLFCWQQILKLTSFLVLDGCESRNNGSLREERTTQI